MHRQPTPAVDRVLSRIKVHPLGCWEFTGALKGNGYGTVQRGGRGEGTTPAHRVTYEDAHGPIPAGLTIDHLCFNPRCVNPAHLEVVTRAENVRRQHTAGRSNGGAPNRAKTHCPRGHTYTAENTYVNAGKRHCRACGREKARERHGYSPRA